MLFSFIMLLDFDGRRPWRLAENSGLRALSSEARLSFERGDEFRAARLMASKLALRALIVEQCKCNTANTCLKCSLFVDAGDLVALLNFFAHKLLELRLRLYKKQHRKTVGDIDMKSEVALVLIYRTLISFAFHSIDTDTSLEHCVESLWLAAGGEAEQRCCEANAFFADSDYHAALECIFTAALSTGNFSSRRTVISILRGGCQLARVSEEKSAQGDSSFYPQAVLYRLISAHDRSQRQLFAGSREHLQLDS